MSPKLKRARMALKAASVLKSENKRGSMVKSYRYPLDDEKARRTKQDAEEGEEGRNSASPYASSSVAISLSAVLLFIFTVTLVAIT